MRSIDKFNTAVNSGKHICVGLDPDIEKIPDHLKNSDDPVFLFNKSIIDTTREETAAYKLNFAFYEATGIEGLTSLKKTIDYIHNNPVRAGIVSNPEDYLYSSARNYAKLDSLIDVICLDLQWKTY